VKIILVLSKCTVQQYKLFTQFIPQTRTLTQTMGTVLNTKH